MVRYLDQAVKGSLACSRRRSEPLGHVPPQFVAATARQLRADLIENVFEARVETRADFVVRFHLSFLDCAPASRSKSISHLSYVNDAPACAIEPSRRRAARRVFAQRLEVRLEVPFAVGEVDSIRCHSATPFSGREIGLRMVNRKLTIGYSYECLSEP
jgi:hypothetical protein